MGLRIGIPRVFLYYTFFPLWEHFFKSLGAVIVVSRETTKKLLDRGVRQAQDETCLPVKLAYGHLLDLAGRTDYIFLPVHKSLEPNKYLCPKIIGLTDLLEKTVPGLPPLLRPLVDLYQEPAALDSSFVEIGRTLGATREDSLRAYREGLACQRQYAALLSQGWQPRRAFDVLSRGTMVSGGESRAAAEAISRLDIALVCHSYISGDSFTTMKLVDRLESMGCRVWLPDSVSHEEICAQTARKLNKELFWTFGTKLLGAGLHFVGCPNIRGMIFLTVFGCGCDAMVEPYLANAAREAGLPYMTLTLDEHTGEAGLVTRVEAFVDMIQRRVRREAGVSSHG